MLSPRWSLAPAVAVLLALGPQASALSTSDYPQAEANPPVPVPATMSCSVTLMTHDFYFSYGAPFTGTYTPPAGCPAPWSRVVLTFSASVSGVQFDRLVDAYVNKVLVYSGSTSEPCCTPAASTPVASTPGATTHWSVQKDVSEYAPVLAAPAPVEVDLNNVYDSTYNGFYHTSLTLTFYETGDHAPMAAHPDFVAPVNDAGNSGVDGYLTPEDNSGVIAPAALTFPRNLTALKAELFAQGHGPCEEFWWSEPNDCGLGTPYREVGIYLDGRLAGAAPVYPVVFTGGDGPGLWEPIPSPRAWNLTPFTVDLTPFAGTLTDGLSHAIALHLFDGAMGAGDYWLLQANLLGWQSGSADRTVGALTSIGAPAAPSESGGWDPSGNVLYRYQAAHALSFSGWIDTPAGRRVTTVTDTMSATTSETQATVMTGWDWKAVSTSTTTAPSGRRESAATSSQEQKFSIDSETLTRFAFTEAGTSDSPSGWSTYSESMTTADATGIAYNGVEREQYGASDSSGLCYDRTLIAAAGEVVADQADSACPTPS